MSFEESAAAGLARSAFQRALVDDASSIFASSAFLQAYGNPQARPAQLHDRGGCTWQLSYVHCRSCRSMHRHDSPSQGQGGDLASSGLCHATLPAAAQGQPSRTPTLRRRR